MCPCGNEDDGAGPCPGPDGRPLCNNDELRNFFGPEAEGIIWIEDEAAQVLGNPPLGKSISPELRHLLSMPINFGEIERTRQARLQQLRDEGISGVVMGPDGTVTPHLDPPPALVAMADQAWKASRDARAEAPQAAAEGRCVSPPIGCGQPLGSALSVAFRDRASRAEYDITGMCQRCQDLMFRPEPSELLAMASDPRNYERCSVCGEWRELEHVDVGVGIMSGHDCCSNIRHRGEPGPPRCRRVAGCGFGADHQYNCDPPPQASTPEMEVERLTEWLVEHMGYDPDEPPEHTQIR